jgi:uncharacterized protein (TIGR01777 family)
MKALVTGATGFIGQRLVATLEKPAVLTRNPQHARQLLGNVEPHPWQGEREPAPSAALDGVDVVFHLAGEPVAQGRWTAEKKRRILDSRKLGTANLVEGIRRAASRPRVLVSASAVGYYGDRGDEVLYEDSPPGNDFLADVCKQWEAEARAATDLGVRVAIARIGIVLGPGGGALAKMLPIFKTGLGGRLASGNQWMPWVHVDDLVAMLHFAAQQDDLRDAFNATAQNPVTNRQFTRELAQALRRPAILPAPAFGLRLMIGEFAEILLSSQRAIPRVLQQAGYRFKYPDLRSALAASLC